MGTKLLTDAFDEITASVVKIKAYGKNNTLSIGTGFLVHRDGYIVTALHVVSETERVEVIPENWPHPIPAKVVLQNRDDMAILAIDYKNLNANYKARFAPATILPQHKHVMSGSEVGIAGYAWGMDNKDYSTLFVFRRTVALNIMHPSHSKGLLYYIDGTAIAGMSGGPVFGFNEGVVGVVVRIKPEKYFQFQTAEGATVIPSSEHLTIALQSYYIHEGLEKLGAHV